MQRQIEHAGTKSAICFAEIRQVFFVLGVSPAFLREQSNPPTPELIVKPFRTFGAGKLTAGDYRNSILYTTISPCDMGADVILSHKIPREIF